MYFLPDESIFLSRGLIFGDDSQLSQEMKNLFQELGLSHFTAASGANLRLFLPDWLRTLPMMNWMSIWALCELLGVSFYLQLASFSPSLWRASVFWALTWGGKTIGRRVPFLLLLTGVVLVTLLTHKEYFGFLGFQLSFLCMVALRFSQASSAHEKSMQELNRNVVFLWIREMFRDSICIFLFLTPLLYYRFGEVVPIGILGTMAATLPLQVFTQLSLLLHVFPSLWFVGWLQEVVYSIIAGIFFCLWFVDLSVLHILVWLGISIGIWSLLVQVRRDRMLWRTVQ